jgi:hypothetical protein
MKLMIVNMTRTSVIYTYRVYDTHDCDFNTHDCDLNTHKSDLYMQSVILTRMSVITTCTNMITTRKIDFYTQSTISTQII